MMVTLNLFKVKPTEPPHSHYSCSENVQTSTLLKKLHSLVDISYYTKSSLERFVKIRIADLFCSQVITVLKHLLLSRYPTTKVLAFRDVFQFLLDKHCITPKSALHKCLSPVKSEITNRFIWVYRILCQIHLHTCLSTAALHLKGDTPALQEKTSHCAKADASRPLVFTTTGSLWSGCKSAFERNLKRRHGEQTPVNLAVLSSTDMSEFGVARERFVFVNITKLFEGE